MVNPYLVDGMDRASVTGTFQDANNPALFGFRFDNPNPLKTVTGITVNKTGSGFLAVLGASGISTPTNNVYNITVNASDGSLNDAKAVAIAVTNINEAPTVTSGATASFAENATGTVYTVTATDPDAATTLSYSLTGSDAARFNINSSTGAVTFITAPNFEVPTDIGANNVYDINVTASDGSLTNSKAVAIAVTNINEAATNVSLSNNTVNENVPIGTVVGLFNPTDVDSSSFIYSFVTGAGGVDNNAFTIAGNTLNTNVVPDFETRPSYSIRVKVDDGSATPLEKVLTVNINDVVEFAPPSTTPTTGDDTLNGSSGSDIISGLAGNDSIFGFAGNDVLNGGAGNDIINGGAGADRMAGGLGSDFFVYNALSDSLFASSDTVSGFNQTQGDRFKIATTPSTTLAAAINVGMFYGSVHTLATATASAGSNFSFYGAVFFQFGSSNLSSRNYLIVDNGDNSYNASNDLFVTTQSFTFKNGDIFRRTVLTVSDYFAP